ncbi:endonuclease/exonuclease/phosphatase family protein [Lentzea sp.]|uniref:endonuclease/exonuclease/phosphatase family protein n=1 Tax=Lentzea sp. TaxID=56099 RepID=UPI002ED634B5
MRPTLPVVGTAVAALVLAAAPAVAAPSTDALISEVYGGGGNSGATLTQDFVELANSGATAFALDGFSVQYISASPGASTQWGVTPLTGSIAPGKTFLVAEAKGTGGTVELPAPDATGTIAMSATGGTIALVSGTTALTCKTAADCAAEPRVKDLVGYGTAAVREGTATGALSNTTSASRKTGLADTDDNSADFAVGAPTPTNSKGETPGGGNPDPDPDPDPTPGDKRIRDVQGVTRVSPLVGQKVTNVPGVVTGTRATGDRGFWIQDTTPDDDPRTSEGVFVYTAGSAPTVAVGDSVLVSGTVAEYRPGGDTGSNQTLTEITSPTTITVSKGNPVPAPVVVKNVPAGYLPAPGGSIEQLPLEPAKYGLDYFESLEGMLVQVDDARVVGPSNTFGEVWVTVNPDQFRTQRGGTIYTGYDQQNSGRLKIKTAGTLPAANVGDVFTGATVGAMEYTNFGGYTLAALNLGTYASSNLQREVTAQQKESELSVATYNVENLDPSDPQEKFDRLADGVTTNLRSPDVLVLEEIQDNNGATNDGVVAADQTLQKFSDAIAAKGGPRYQWRQIDPENLKDGGEPGGNIRVGFFFNPQRVSFVDRPGGDFKTPVQVVKKNGRAALSVSPGRIDPLNDAWTASRKPLAGEFKFRGRTVFVVANHFNSKGGDEAIHGRNQPPTRSSEVQRAKQAAALKAFTEQIRAIDKGANVVLAGDLNDYQFSPALKTLTGDGNLKALIETLPVSERYSYVFEGNSQTLDHLLMSKNITRFSYDVVHINAEFADQASDHDPQIVRARPSTGDANVDKIVFALEDIIDCLKK